jgi:hypothetical protein
LGRHQGLFCSSRHQSSGGRIPSSRSKPLLHDGLIRVAIYLRVSTAKQDTNNQRLELEAVARNCAAAC